jgi:hypothetical protein
MEEGILKHIKEQPVDTQTLLINFFKSAVDGGQSFTDFLGDMTPSTKRKFDKERKRMFVAGCDYMKEKLNLKVLLEKLEDVSSQST